MWTVDSPREEPIPPYSWHFNICHEEREKNLLFNNRKLTIHFVFFLEFKCVRIIAFPKTVEIPEGMTKKTNCNVRQSMWKMLCKLSFNTHENSFISVVATMWRNKSDFDSNFRVVAVSSNYL